MWCWVDANDAWEPVTVHCLSGTVRLAAVHPDSGTLEAIAVDVYMRPVTAATDTVSEVVPGAWVTQDHAVSICQQVHPPGVPPADVSIHGPDFQGTCTWIAGTLPWFQDRARTVLDGVYHLCPVDFHGHVRHAVVIGAQWGTAVAELYRSSASTLLKLNGFRRV